ncbi:PTS sugar transporter subunit IIA [Mycoplasmopsis felifaucium]|uniref:PTS sugar transporter subunit IIA n=1 Tax=Mycoplasmopsis felifaucium TaxID=35768 RepID=UPI000481020C|nr:PTS sugar transporter subunit IIA [Mycoplasmopsis felifaucium]
MTKKDKFLIVILTIFTIGFCWIYWQNKNKKIKDAKKGNIQKLDTNMNVAELINLLGTKSNIKEVSASVSGVKIEFFDKNKVDFESIKKLKYVSGLMISTNKTTLIVGEYAKKLAQEINSI